MKIVIYIILGLIGFSVLTGILRIVAYFLARAVRCKMCPYRGKYCVPDSLLCNPEYWGDKK